MIVIDIFFHFKTSLVSHRQRNQIEYYFGQVFNIAKTFFVDMDSIVLGFLLYKILGIWNLTSQLQKNTWTNIVLNGSQLRSGRVTHFKSKCSKTNIFLLPTYLVYQNLLTNALSRSKNIIQVLNELPTDKRHIKVPQGKLLCPPHVDNKKKNRFSKI